MTEEQLVECITTIWKQRERKMLEMARREARDEIIQTLEVMGIATREQVAQYYAEGSRAENNNLARAASVAETESCHG